MLTPFFDDHVGNVLYTGHALDLLRELPAASVQLALTSPPFFGLRSYGTVQWKGGDSGHAHFPARTGRGGSGPNSKNEPADFPAAAHRGGDPTACACGARRVSPTVWGGSSTCEHSFIGDPYYRGGSPANISAALAFSEPGQENADRVAQGRWRNDQTCALCGAWRGDLGLEPTLDLYLDHLVEVFRELRRVLTPDGLLFVELGDSYAGAGYSNHANTGGAQREQGGKQHHTRSFRPGSWRGNGVVTEDSPRNRDGLGAVEGFKPKTLMLVPHRFAIRMVDDGWILRQDNIWVHMNGMPEAVLDRTTRNHSYIFQFALNEKYFYDAAAVAEPLAQPLNSPSWKQRSRNGATSGNISTSPDVYQNAVHGQNASHDLGGQDGTRNLRSVWPLSSEGSRVSHFATWPQALARRIILCGSRHGDTVLDPFSGSGTSSYVAKNLGRNSIGLELFEEYNAIGARRLAQGSSLPEAAVFAPKSHDLSGFFETLAQSQSDIVYDDETERNDDEEAFTT